MRAREPDVQGVVNRDGLNLGYEVFGDGPVTVLLMPTWTIIHTRFWKAQIPYLARYYRVISYDGPGNGRTERVTDPTRYTSESYAADAVAVLDECGADQAVVVGLSLGGTYAAQVAGLYPDRVVGIVLVAAALGITPMPPARASIATDFLKPYPADPVSWQKYNLAYWHDHYQDFVEFFMAQIFTEPHSTKQWEDSIGWALETSAAVLEAQSKAFDMKGGVEILKRIQCPVLAIHGTEDAVIPYEQSREAVRITGGRLVTMSGSGHNPLARDPVKVNLVLRDFIEEVAR